MFRGISFAEWHHQKPVCGLGPTNWLKVLLSFQKWHRSLLPSSTLHSGMQSGCNTTVLTAEHTCAIVVTSNVFLRRIGKQVTCNQRLMVVKTFSPICARCVLAVMSRWDALIWNNSRCRMALLVESSLKCLRSCPLRVELLLLLWMLRIRRRAAPTVKHRELHQHWNSMMACIARNALTISIGLRFISSN